VPRFFFDAVVSSDCMVPTDMRIREEGNIWKKSAMA
jgi:hypothetical protein